MLIANYFFMNKINKVSIIVPCYNEIKTLGKILDLLKNLDLGVPFEVIIVDDGSTDGSADVLHDWKSKQLPNFKFLQHQQNQGKGAAIQTALKVATGDYICMQDADLEYNPLEIKKLVNYTQANNTLAVYGSRNRNIKNKYLYPHFFWGSKILYVLINWLYHNKLTDPETCYKLIKKELLDFISLTEKGFGIEIEITAKLSNINIQIHEVSISYHPRSFKDGKKITAVDGAKALWLILKYKVRDLQYGLVDKLIRHIRIKAALPFLQSKNKYSLLDVGCGRQARLGWSLRKKVSQYTGIDNSLDQLDILNLKLLPGNIENLSELVPPDSHDTIIALALIEHIDNPDIFLRACYNIIKSGGKIILTTPPPRSKFILELISRMGIIDRREIDEHKNYFTLIDLTKMLESTGFSIVTKKHFLVGFNSLIVAKK